MPAQKAHFVTACQQLLALAAVLAVLTPAAGVVSLELSGPEPTGTTSRVAPGGSDVSPARSAPDRRR